MMEFSLQDVKTIIINPFYMLKDIKENINIIKEIDYIEISEMKYLEKCNT
jgi:hypothetical protein